MIRADGATEDDPLRRVPARLLDEPAAVTNAFRRDQDALGVHAVQDVAEAVPFLTDERIRRQLDVVEEDLGRAMIHHRLDRPDREAITRGPHVDQERRQPLASFLHTFQRRCAREEKHEVRVLGA